MFGYNLMFSWEASENKYCDTDFVIGGGGKKRK
jgi:hypothetical protein